MQAGPRFHPRLVRAAAQETGNAFIGAIHVPVGLDALLTGCGHDFEQTWLKLDRGLLAYVASNWHAFYEPDNTSIHLRAALTTYDRLGAA